jgi:hypothetical protein
MPRLSSYGSTLVPFCRADEKAEAALSKAEAAVFTSVCEAEELFRTDSAAEISELKDEYTEESTQSLSGVISDPSVLTEVLLSRLLAAFTEEVRLLLSTGTLLPFAF